LKNLAYIKIYGKLFYSILLKKIKFHFENAPSVLSVILNGRTFVEKSIALYGKILYVPEFHYPANYYLLSIEEE